MKAATEMRKTPKTGIGNHVIASFCGDAHGPTLIVVGGIHGNEPAGVEALIRVSTELSGLSDKLSGRVYFIAGNTRALPEGVRFIDRDLNRSWTRNNLGSLGAQRAPKVSECRELTEIDSLLDSILITARDEVYVLDLHSTSADGVPFATVGDTLRNREFAQKFPVTILLGIEEQLEGTMLEYLNNAGAVTLGFEGGSHSADSTVDNHVSMVWLAIANAGLLHDGKLPEIGSHRTRLAAGMRRPRVVEVRYREAIKEADAFQMLQGFNNFDPVREDQVLAHNSKGLVRAPEAGLVLMPLYQKLGEDGFFVGREVAPFWLTLSAILRRLRVQELMPWFPGIRKDPNDHESLIVNTRTARFFPLQIFHLLGFRRRRWNGNDLVVSRRRHDTVSPFRGNGV